MRQNSGDRKILGKVKNCKCRNLDVGAHQILKLWGHIIVNSGNVPEALNCILC